MTRPKGSKNNKPVTSHPIGELDIVDEPREVATQYKNPIESVLLSTNETAKDYIILENSNRFVLEKQVKGLFDNGCNWECQGGVSVTSWQGISGREYLYVQAMVRRD